MDTKTDNKKKYPDLAPLMDKNGKKPGRISTWIYRQGPSLILLAPFAILFFLFTILPILAAIVLSFTYFNMGSAPTFVGLDNYIRMFFDDKVFWTALKNTAIFAIITGKKTYLKHDIEEFERHVY